MKKTMGDRVRMCLAWLTYFSGGLAFLSWLGFLVASFALAIMGARDSLVKMMGIFCISSALLLASFIMICFFLARGLK